MRLQILLLVLLAGLASIAFCEDGAEKDSKFNLFNSLPFAAIFLARNVVI